MKDVVEARVGLMTSDNARFLRFWWEVCQSNVLFHATSSEEAQKSKRKWFPHNKGGPFRKWAGNQEYLVNWENNGQEIKAIVVEKYPYLDGNPNFVVHDDEYYFRPSVSWSEIAAGANGFRAYPSGFTFNVKGMCVFPNADCTQEQLLMLGNSKYVSRIAKVINPTLGFGVGDFGKLPAALLPHDLICDSATALVKWAQTDWDSYETSWDFTTLPLLRPEHRQAMLAATYAHLSAHWQAMTDEMQRLEEENNRIFIAAYGLQDELTPDVPLHEITLTCNPHYRYGAGKSGDEYERLLLADTLREFISYAVGCMFGRYSLDKPGLVLANQGESVEDYVQKIGEWRLEIGGLSD